MTHGKKALAAVATSESEVNTVNSISPNNQKARVNTIAKTPPQINERCMERSKFLESFFPLYFPTILSAAYANPSTP